MLNRITQFRSLLKNHNLDGFLIPTKDEFMQDSSDRLHFMTGFSGSNGVALINHDHAILFTDGRYLLQAENELQDFFLVVDIAELYDNKFLKGKIGYDPKLHTMKNLSLYQNCDLVPCENLVDQIWVNKPIAKSTEIFEYPLKYSGETSASKLAKIAAYLQENDLDALVITDPTNICWLSNLRARDLEHMPIFLSYAIVTKDGILSIFHNDRVYNVIPDEDTVFDQEKLLRSPVSATNSSLPGMTKMIQKIKSLHKVQIDPNTTSSWIAEQIASPIFKEDPCTLWKAGKNSIEIQQMKRIHIIDGTAICKMLYWLENNSPDELEVAEKLLEFRSMHPDFICPSFTTIAGFADHGAIIHYHATEHTNKKIEGNGLLLVDSGGQYFGGTTDITRTILIGKASHQQKHDFTLVLKGHIAVAMSQFPQGTKGMALDVIARQSLWQDAKDYAHATGHGVGNCLNVHEYPTISKISNAELKAGMILANEPGYYKKDEYGIRIESLMLVKQLKNGYFAMETLSLAPIDRRLILTKLLTVEEKKWLNFYHQEVYKKISPHLNDKEKSWLYKSFKNKEQSHKSLI